MCEVEVVVYDGVFAVCGVVFYFKQKTAYEMRISDWSSDVCSSDLAAFRTMSAAAPGTVTAAVLIIGNEILSGRTQDANLAFLGTSLNEKIGRAPRRERVCQYV